MAYDKNSQFSAQAHHQKSFFIIRMVGIEISDGSLIIKDRFSFVEGNPVFFLVGRIFLGIPRNANYNYIVINL